MRQAPAPSHWPSRSQLAAPSSGQLPCGSVPAGTTPHSPSGPEPLSAVVQAMHVPVHVVLQHTPSTQFALAHCGALAHAAPPGRSASHVPVARLQYAVLAQSASAAQPVAQAAALPHAKGAHDELELGRHWPDPLQVKKLNAPPEQAVAHAVPTGNSAQVPVPLHEPVVAQLVASRSGHSSSGSVFAATAPHSPSSPEPLRATLHAWHVAEQLELQHTPSTHCPEPHWAAPAHGAPFP